MMINVAQQMFESVTLYSLISKPFAASTEAEVKDYSALMASLNKASKQAVAINLFFLFPDICTSTTYLAAFSSLSPGSAF